MTENKGISRRDFLTIGGITAGALGAATLLDLVTDGGVSHLNEAGGFYVRYHDADNPPYDVDDNIYQKPDGTDTSFTRNPDLTIERNVNSVRNIEEGHVGDDWLGYAYAAGAQTFMFDSDMYAWEGMTATQTPYPEGRWIPEDHGYTVDDTTKIIKRSSKLFGASLVGIAALDERWFYSKYMDLTAIITGGGDGAPPPEVMQAMMPQILGQMDPEAFKEMLLGALENMDPELLPAMVNPEMMVNMSGEMLQQMMPQMMGNADPAMMAALMENIDPAMMPEMSPGAGMDMGAMVQAMAYDLEFSDDVEALVIEAKKRIIPRTMNRVVVMAFEMDPTGIDTQVSQLGDGAAMNGYSRMAFTSACLANMIRRLGYNAIPMGNDHAVSPPMAVDAGLGEIGRNGLLITPRYGPRVRLAKVLTDMPLKIDRPISFGVTEFCEVCGKCAEYCPSQSISHGERTYEAPDSGNPGFLHWPIDGDSCFGEWTRVGGSCYHCIRVCPFNKPESWLHEMTRILIGVQSGPLDSLLLKLDDVSGYGPEEGNDPADFWDKDYGYVHIKDIDV